MEVSQYTLANQTNEQLERTVFKICLLPFIKTLSILVPEMQTVRIVLGSQRLGLEAGYPQLFGRGNSFLLGFILTMKALSHPLSPFLWV